MKTKHDPAIAEVRRVRCQISREFNNDPRRLVEHYMKLQAVFEGRLIPGPDDNAAQQAAAADGALRHR